MQIFWYNWKQRKSPSVLHFLTSPQNPKSNTGSQSPLRERGRGSKMDVKAMARSKRSHTKQHQPRKPHRPNTHPLPTPTNAAPSSSTSASHHPKAVKAEAGKKSSLPSNWDRYDDSDDDDDPLFDSASADVVKPKSKGADFAFLVSEAKSQSAATFPDSLDHILPDFYEGLGSMLSARGENFLSWTGVDDFYLDDEATANTEVPFLSLNLQLLAEELGRMDLAKRLFIEEDILPPELRALPKIEKDDKILVSTSVEQNSGDDNLAFQTFSNVEKRIVSKEGHSLQQDSVGTTLQDPLLCDPLDDILADHKSDSFRGIVPKESFKATQETNINYKIPRFEAGVAEAELDMLLGSFDDTQFFGSTNIDNRGPFNDSAHPDLSTSSFSTKNLDTDIDDLLQDTSHIAEGHVSSRSVEVNADTTGKQASSSSQPVTKSKVMEDFGSWLDTI